MVAHRPRDGEFMLRILLADDHDVVRRGLRDILTQQSDWQICGEAATGIEAVEMAVSLRPTVAVLDLTMPELNGLEATRQIKKAAPTVEVLIFTIHESEQLIHEVLTAGARGYLLKSDASRYIVAAVETVAQQRPFLTWRASEATSERLLTRRHFQKDAGDPLTPREREIVQLLAEGNSSKKISAVLGISLKTVETHRTSVMRKLGAHSIVDIVHYAVRNNLAHP
jgi:DNA-binding NarL/FixJ family response regulator